VWRNLLPSPPVATSLICGLVCAGVAGGIGVVPGITTTRVPPVPDCKIGDVFVGEKAARRHQVPIVDGCCAMNPYPLLAEIKARALLGDCSRHPHRHEARKSGLRSIIQTAEAKIFRPSAIPRYCAGSDQVKPRANPDAVRRCSFPVPTNIDRCEACR